MRTLKQHFTLDRLGLSIGIALIFYTYRHFLFSNAASGWDTLPQIHLFAKMARLLKQGMVFGYDLEWFGGFPIFIFYGFLPYLVAACIHLLTAGLISIVFLAKLTMLSGGVLVLHAVYIFIGTFFGKKYRLMGIVAIQVFLFSPLNPHMGIGLGGGIHHGLFLNLFGAALILYALNYLEKYAQTNRLLYFSLAILFTAAIAFSHVISSIAAAIILSTYFISTGQFKRWAIFSAWVLLLTAFYLYPYLRYSEFTNPIKMSSSFVSVYALIGLNYSPDPLRLVEWKDYLRLFPPYSVLIFTCFLMGSFQLCREKKWFLPLAIALYLILIPTNVLYNMADLTIHYYRLSSYFLVIYLLIAGYQLGSFALMTPPKYKWLTYAAVILFFVPLINNFPFKGEYIDWGGAYAADKQAIDYVVEEKPAGRVFAERSYQVPNPHLFTVALPMSHGVPAIFGLLMESADSSHYIVPPFMTISENLVWGGTLYLMASLPYEKILEKIADLGVDYLILNRPFSTQAMAEYLKESDHPVATLRTQIGPHQIFQMKNPLPLVSLLEHAPILLINKHWAYSNTDIIHMLYRSELSPKVKMAVWDKKADWPNDQTLNMFETVIVVPSKQGLPAHLPMNFTGKRIIFFGDGTFNMKEGGPPQIGTSSIFFMTFAEYGNLMSLLNGLVPKDGPAQAVKTEFVSDTKITFDSDRPTVVNIGYFPYWRTDDNAEVFRLSPSKLLIFAKGKTVLRFKLPVAQKLLMLLALAALVSLSGFVYRDEKRLNRGTSV